MSKESWWSLNQVSQHASEKDCWVILFDQVYDLTKFLPLHPGGRKVILEWAGKDATEAFLQIHSPDLLNNFKLPAGSFKGQLKDKLSKVAEKTTIVKKSSIPLYQILNLQDFEAAAKEVLTAEAWAYYSSGAGDELTLRENQAAFVKRFWLIPRVMRNVRHVDPSSHILGYPTDLPIYITSTALGKLGHPEGEVVLTRAAAQRNIIQVLPTLASCSLKEMTQARSKGQVQFYQLYVNPDRMITEKVIKEAEERGCKALWVTVDAPQLGKREKDMRNKFTKAPPDAFKENSLKEAERGKGVARAISGWIDPSVCWDDLAWFRSITKLPIVLKGVQCAADAVLAAKYGCEGIVLSNHGGRQLDTARPAIDILPEVMSALKSHGLRMEVYVDGGVRRGTDIFKALALGATAVGIGRPFLYAMSAYGDEGVTHCIDLIREELEMTMRLMGTPKVEDIKYSHVISKDLSNHSYYPTDYLVERTYEPLNVASKL